MRVSRLTYTILFSILTFLPSHSQTIYPLNRAEILAGSKFDFKVEFPNAPKEADVSVTINGKDVIDALGKKPQFIEREDGQDYSALVLRDVSLT